MSADFADALVREDLKAAERIPRTDIHHHALFGAM